MEVRVEERQKREGRERFTLSWGSPEQCAMMGLSYTAPPASVLGTDAELLVCGVTCL